MGVVLARAPAAVAAAAAIFLTCKNSVSFVPGLFLASKPILPFKASAT